ncbi:hypothetical protein SNE40_002174 [Patella caerulea]|uniref:CARD domain-containing protein n=1 Tax=Patella caerulea TaxID=87958 RepID=A0AAN8JWC6_PATCE
MDEEGRKKLQCNRTFLLDEISPDHGLSDAMFSAQIFDQDDLDEINSKATRREKMECFLDILVHSGREAYGEFLKGLERKSYRHVIRRLEETDLSTVGVKERGSLNEPERTILQREFSYLTEEVRAKDLVRDMFQEGLLTEDEVTTVTNAEEKKGRNVGMGKCIDFLFHSGPNAYQKFLTCLQKAKYNHVYEHLITKAEAYKEKK